MIVLMTGVLLFKAPAHDNHKLLSYDMIIDNGLSYHIIDNGFCNMIITLSILLHITTQQSIQPLQKIWKIQCCNRYSIRIGIHWNFGIRKIGCHSDIRLLIH